MGIIIRIPENLFFYKLIVASIVEVATKVVCMGWGWGGNPTFVALFIIIIAFLVIADIVIIVTVMGEILKHSPR